jgi:hypothetical protein
LQAAEQKDINLGPILSVAAVGWQEAERLEMPLYLSEDLANTEFGRLLQIPQIPYFVCIGA